MAVNNNLDVRNTAVGGTIENFEVIDGGENYYSADQGDLGTNVYVVGNGTGFVGTPIIKGSQNTISGISITNPGRGYTIAKLMVNGQGSNANIRPIISPPLGHGYDNTVELGARYVMFNTRLDFSEGGGDFPTVNDYRRIGLVRNPVSNYTGNIALERTLDATYTMYLSDVYGAYDTDEIIKGSNSLSNAIVVSATTNTISNTAIIRYSSTNSDTDLLVFSVGEVVTGNTNSTTGTITSIVEPEVVPYTGDVLYVENRKKIIRSWDQAENIHVVISF